MLPEKFYIQGPFINQEAVELFNKLTLDEKEVYECKLRVNYYLPKTNSSRCGASSKYLEKEGYVKITEEDFLRLYNQKEEEFVLPEKWCIKITKENKEYLQSTDNILFRKGYDYTLYAYYSPRQGSNSLEGRTEITVEQFKKYVMKETEKNILGYLVKPEFKEIATKAFELVDKAYLHSGELASFAAYSFKRKEVEEAGVLNLWFDPIYEEQVETLELVVHGSNKNLYLKVNSKGELWEYLGKNFESFERSTKVTVSKYINTINNVLSANQVNVCGYMAFPISVQIGCWNDVNCVELRNACVQLQQFLVKHNLWSNP